MSKAGAKQYADITAELVNPTPATQKGGAAVGYARVSTRGHKLDDHVKR